MPLDQQESDSARSAAPAGSFGPVGVANEILLTVGTRGGRHSGSWKIEAVPGAATFYVIARDRGLDGAVKVSAHMPSERSAEPVWVFGVTKEHIDRHPENRPPLGRPRADRYRVAPHPSGSVRMCTISVQESAVARLEPLAKDSRHIYVPPAGRPDRAREIVCAFMPDVDAERMHDSEHFIGELSIHSGERLVVGHRLGHARPVRVAADDAEPGSLTGLILGVDNSDGSVIVVEVASTGGD